MMTLIFSKFFAGNMFHLTDDSENIVDVLLILINIYSGKSQLLKLLTAVDTLHKLLS